MSEETPAIISLTVIWRPLEETEYRIDHVTCEANCQIAAISAAADIYAAELEYAVTSKDVIENGYDLIAIFEGYLVEHVQSS